MVASSGNVDLIVRAISREHAEIAWRDHFAGWDMPDRPRAITKIPVNGVPGPLSWDVLTSDIQDDAEEEREAQAPSI